jgi:hypothetical protein
VTTKQEIAESLTVPELRSLADEHGIDLTGLSAKQDIADAVAAGATKDQLESAAEGDQSGASSTLSLTSTTPNPAAQAGPGGYVSPEELQKRGQSAADLEMGVPIVGGEPIIIKSFPERQSQPEVEAATEEQPGPLVSTVTVTDGDGSQRDVELTPDESARITSTVGVARHPIHEAAGHGANPNLAAWGDNEEAVAENEKAYAARTQS